MVALAALLLAAGESKRMGALKPLLPWGPPNRPGEPAQTLIEYQLVQLAGLPADRIVVVLGHQADELLPVVRRAGAVAVVNELYAEGRASSVRVGAAALPEDTQTLVILNVDQPRPLPIIKRLVDAHRAGRHLITVPVYEGQRGHPLVVDGCLLPELRQVQEATQGVRALLTRHCGRVAEVPFDSPLVLLDINRPEEYDRARDTFFQQVRL